MKHGDVRYLQVSVVQIGSSTNGVPHWVEVACDIAQGAGGAKAHFCVPTARLLERLSEPERPMPNEVVTGRVRELIHRPGADLGASIVVGGMLLTQGEQKALMDGLAKGHRMEIAR